MKRFGFERREAILASWSRHMRRGEFEAAWAVSDAVLRTRSRTDQQYLPPHLRSVWDGAPLEGKRVLVRCYHGLGDTIQFIRYAPAVKKIARELTVLTQPELIPLLRTVPGIDRLLPLNTPESELSYDVDIEIMELPYFFRTTVASIPAEIPYLYTGSEKVPADERFRVGLVWASGDWDVRRSIPFTLLAPLAAIPHVNLHIIQRGAALEERPDGFGLLCGSDDPWRAARVINGLHLLISVDSMPAHLAGALGVPVWNLLHADSDWRWMENRDDTPWYPTMRLFRQKQAGEWEPVIAIVLSELQRLEKHGAWSTEHGARNSKGERAKGKKTEIETE